MEEESEGGRPEKREDKKIDKTFAIRTDQKPWRNCGAARIHGLLSAPRIPFFFSFPVQDKNSLLELQSSSSACTKPRPWRIRTGATTSTTRDTISPSRRTNPGVSWFTSTASNHRRGFIMGLAVTPPSSQVASIHTRSTHRPASTSSRRHSRDRNSSINISPSHSRTPRPRHSPSNHNHHREPTSNSRSRSAYRQVQW